MPFPVSGIAIFDRRVDAFPEEIKVQELTSVSNAERSWDSFFNSFDVDPLHDVYIYREGLLWRGFYRDSE